MRRAIHKNKPHPDIASSLDSLGIVYDAMGKPEKSLEHYEQSLHKNQSHFDVAMSLGSVGFVYYKQKKLNHAADFLEQSLEMLRILNSRNTLHSEISTIGFLLTLVYAEQAQINS